MTSDMGSTSYIASNSSSFDSSFVVYKKSGIKSSNSRFLGVVSGAISCDLSPELLERSIEKIALSMLGQSGDPKENNGMLVLFVL